MKLIKTRRVVTPFRWKWTFYCLFAFQLTLSNFSHSAGIEPYTRLTTVKAPDSPLPNTWGIYKTDEYTGSFTYQYPISIPAGVNDLAPTIDINYNSHLAMSMPGWIGAGWELSSYSYIQRDINHTRKDTSDDKFQLYWFGRKFDLVETQIGSTSNIQYFVTSFGEQFIKIIRSDMSDSNADKFSWLIETVEGKRYRFDEQHLVNSTDTSIEFPWRWSLSEISNSTSNDVKYSYLDSPNSPDRGAIYLDKIEYLNKVIQFEYEARPDSYIYVYQGSEIKYGSRLKGISVLDKNIDLAFARFEFRYVLNEAGSKSLLTQIVSLGDAMFNDDSRELITKFNYSEMDKTFESGFQWDSRTSVKSRPLRQTKENSNDLVIDIVDITGDGLPDFVLQADTDGPWTIYENINGKEFSISKHSGNWDNVTEAIREVKSGGDISGMLSDLNKDGYLDYLRYVGSDNISVHYNQGGQGWSDEDIDTWSRPDGSEIDFREITSSNDDTLLEQDLIDLTGDGYPDLVKASNNEIYIWRGSKSGFKDREIWSFPEDHIGFTDAGDLEQGLFDMNGDGLPDFVDGSSSNWSIHLNTGSGFLTPDSTIDAEKFIISATFEGHVVKQLMDINGDGLPDYVDGGTRDIQVRLNKGTSFSDEVIWLVEGDKLLSGRIRESDDSQRGVIRDYIDMNGDRLPDIVEKNDDGTLVRLNQSIGSDLLSGLTTTYGGITEVVYTSSRDFQNTRLPFSQMVVSRIEEDNGMTNDHRVKTNKKFEYSGGVYDFADMDFRGFSDTKIRQKDFKQETFKYHQGDIKKGKVFEYSLESDDGDFTEFEEVYVYDTDKDTVGSETVYYVFPESTQRTYLNANPRVITTVNYKFDHLGNVLEEEHLGDIDIEGDERFILRQFSDDSNKICKEMISEKKDSEPFRIIENFYDEKNTLCDQDNFDHLLTKKVIKKNRDDHGYQYQWKFDNRGRLTSSTDSNGHITSYSYDKSFRLNPTNISITASSTEHKTIREYDSFNNIISETAPSGSITQYQFDKFYRPLKTIKPYDSVLEPTELWEYEIDGSAPESIIHRRKFSPSKSLEPQYSDRYVFVDGFARVIQEKSPFSSQLNTQIAENTHYDSLGRVSKVDNPQLVTNSDLYSSNAVSSSNSGTSFFYSISDRLFRTVDPEGHKAINFYSGLSIETFIQVANSELLLPKRVYRFDPYNQLVQFKELDSDGNDLKVTEYVYSPVGDLLSITDQADNSWAYKYDQLSSILEYVDPDRGEHSFTFDGEQNLLSHIDARGVMVSRSYDELNRVTAINYQNDYSPVFTYDQGKVGTLSNVTNEFGKTTYSYDDRLRMLNQTSEMDDFTWATSWSYDSSSNVMEMVDPNDAKTLYTYGNDTKLKSISGIADRIDYSLLGQYSEIRYSNMSRLSRSFDNQTLRLRYISSTSPSSAGTTKRYTFDDFGNISQIDDTEFGVTNYGYDDLDQLISAKTIGGESKFYDYDLLGNIESVTGSGKADFYFHSQSKIHQILKVESNPEIAYFLLGSDGIQKGRKSAILNILASGEPTQMRISLSQSFSNSLWLDFNNLHEQSFNSFGDKTLYIQVRNSLGTSQTQSTTFNLQTDDLDSDGVKDFQDNCPNIPNQSQSDLDSDSIGDVCDSDTDGDGISNKWETDNGLDPTNPNDAKDDPDNDGFSNLEEFIGRSNPRDATSTPKEPSFLPVIYEILLGKIKSIFRQDSKDEPIAMIQG